MRPLWRLLIGAAIVFPIVVICCYLFTFVPASSYSLSHKPEDWACFGEYLGGTVGAFYGFLAFVGVLFSLSVQRDQARLDELQRLMATVSQTIDVLFAADPKQVEPAERHRITAGIVGPMSVFSILSAVGTRSIELGNSVPLSNDNELMRRGTETIRQECGVIVIELQQLVQLSEKYAESGGSDVITNFYQMRYRVPVRWLDSVGLLTSEIVAKYFQDRH